MSNTYPDVVGAAKLRTVAMPRDSTSTAISSKGQRYRSMNLAGGILAASHSGNRVGTVQIDAMEFLKPVSVGGGVSMFCWLGEEGRTSVSKPSLVSE